MAQRKQGKLIIVGGGELAEIAHEYFTNDSPYKVVAFSAEHDFLKKKELFGLPVVPFEDVERLYPPRNHKVFVAVSFTELNRVRTRLLREAKRKGYAPVSYVSSRAFVWGNVQVGENCFIFENTVVQHRSKLGNNVIVWSGSIICHRTTIGDNTFVGPHVVISGYCEVGKNCFLGANTSTADELRIGKDCVTGVGTVVVRNLEGGKVYVGNPARPTGKSSFAAFGVREP